VTVWSFIGGATRISATAAMLVLSFPVVTRGATSPSEKGGVELSIHLCDFLPKHFTGGTLRYTIDGTGGIAAQRSFRWDSDDQSVLRWSARVPAGVYQYDAYGLVTPSSLPCRATGFVAVLPGSFRRIDASMYGGIADQLVPLLIYGTLPAGVSASILRFDTAAACGAAIRLSGNSAVDVERDGVGFYASDLRVSGSEKGSVVFGIRVEQPQQEARTFRLVADYPRENIAVPPTAVRFDISQAMIKSSLKSPPNTLVCVPGSSHG
jgi:hypothetical protein